MRGSISIGVWAFRPRIAASLECPSARLIHSYSDFPKRTTYAARPRKIMQIKPVLGYRMSSFSHRSLTSSHPRHTPPNPHFLSTSLPALDTAGSAAINPKNGKISCSYFDKTGAFSSKHREFTKAEIAEQFELRHRDLRDIDLKSEAVTRILVRPHTILLQFFHLCMVIQADEALLINNHPDDQQERSEALYEEFRSRISSPTLESADVPELPYELRAVEAALVAVLSTLRHDLVRAREQAEDAARSLRLDSGQAAIGLDRVFERTRLLAKVEQKARLVRDTLRELLDTDEDLAAMYLSDRLAGRAHATADHQEAEYMLEAYHKAADTLVESAQAAIDVLRKKENTFRSSLAVQRNQIMFLEARIAIHTLGLASGTMVAGLFGMNLVNYMEESPYGFPMITGVCVVLSSLFSIYGMRSLRRIQTLKGIRHSRFGR